MSGQGRMPGAGPRGPTTQGLPMGATLPGASAVPHHSGVAGQPTFTLAPGSMVPGTAPAPFIPMNGVKPAQGQSFASPVPAAVAQGVPAQQAGVPATAIQGMPMPVNAMQGMQGGMPGAVGAYPYGAPASYMGGPRGTPMFLGFPNQISLIQPNQGNAPNAYLPQTVPSQGGPQVGMMPQGFMMMQGGAPRPMQQQVQQQQGAAGEAKADQADASRNGAAPTAEAAPKPAAPVGAAPTDDPVVTNAVERIRAKKALKAAQKEEEARKKEAEAKGEAYVPPAPAPVPAAPAPAPAPAPAALVLESKAAAPVPVAAAVPAQRAPSPAIPPAAPIPAVRPAAPVQPAAPAVPQQRPSTADDADGDAGDGGDGQGVDGAGDMNFTSRGGLGTGVGLQRGDPSIQERQALLAKRKADYNTTHEPKKIISVATLLKLRDDIRAKYPDAFKANVWPDGMKKHKLIGGRQRDTSDDPITLALKFVKSVLNKLTRENFNKLSLDLLRYDVASQDMLEKIIEVVFDKALEDVKYQDLFADLCKLLGEKAVEWSKKYLKVAHLKDKAAPAGDGWYYDLSGSKGTDDAEWNGPMESEDKALEAGRRETNFKRLLLNRCQTEFTKANPRQVLSEQEDEDKEARSKIKEEGREPTAEEEASFKERAASRDYALLQAKKRFLSNVGFIGHLYVAGGQLTVQIINYCVLRLLGVENLHKQWVEGGREPDFSAAEHKPDPDNVEALCKLLALVGRRYEKEDSTYNEKCKVQVAQVPSLAFYADASMSSRIVTWLGQLRRNPNLESRLRFRCQDTLELKEKSWVVTGAAADLERQSKTLTLAEAKAAIIEQERREKEALMGTGQGPREGYERQQLGASARAQARSGGGPQDARMGGGQGGPSGPGGPRPSGPRAAQSGLGKAMRPGTPQAGSGARADGDEWTTVTGKGTAAPSAPGARPGWQGGASSGGADAAGEAPRTPAAPSTVPAAPATVYSGDELHKRVKGIMREWVSHSAKEEEVFAGLKELAASPGMPAAAVQETLAALAASGAEAQAFIKEGGAALVALSDPASTPALAAILGSSAPLLAKGDVLEGVAAWASKTLVSVDLPKLAENAVQVLAPVLCAGLVSLADLLPCFHVAMAPTVNQSTGAYLLAQLAAAVLSKEEASSAPVRAALLASLTEDGSAGPRSLPLLRVIGPANMADRAKKTRNLLVSGCKDAQAKTALEGSLLVQELDAAVSVCKDVRGLLEEGAADAAAEVARRVTALAPAVKASPHFARYLASQWTFFCLARASESEGELAAELSALSAALAPAKEASLAAHGSQGVTDTTLGAYMLSGVQAAFASSDEFGAESLLPSAIPGLQPVFSAEAWRAWAGAEALKVAAPLTWVVAEPMGRTDVAGHAAVKALLA